MLVEQTCPEAHFHAENYVKCDLLFFSTCCIHYTSVRTYW